jgi:hypothetical protein
MIQNARQAQLLKVVLALGVASRFAGRLNGWKQQRNQRTDNRDDDQQFN